MNFNISEKKKYIFLSFLFALSIGQFAFFEENHVNLLRALANDEFSKLEDDWLANQIDHTPLFTIISTFIINYTSLIGLNVLHIFLSAICSISIFYICKKNFSNYDFEKILFFWFLFLFFIFKEKSFAYGVAGQYLLNPAYQPATFGVFILSSLALFLYRRDVLAIIFVILSASIHPTYIIQAFFLICGYLIYFLINKDLKNIFKISLLSIIFILPIVYYLFFNFYISDFQVNFKAQSIMAENRIPHHAMVSSWFSYKDLQIILLIFFSLWLMFKEKRLFIPVSFVVLASIILTIIQYFTSSNFLGLLFPWRSSVYIVPLCSMIVLSKFLFFLHNKYFTSVSKKSFYLNTFSFFIIIFLSFDGILETYNSNISHKKNYSISNMIKKHDKDIKRILIPTNLKQIRLNTKLPIFVDWKSAPFKNNAVIEWYERIKLTNSFYGSSDYENQKRLFMNINNIEQITHILIKDNDKNFLFNDCEYIFKEKGYLFYDLRECS